MPRKPSAAKHGKGKTNEPVSSQEKIARLLGIIATKEMTQRTHQVTMLRAVGFEVAEIASLLGITTNHVKVASHHGRKKRTRTPARKTRKRQ